MRKFNLMAAVAAAVMTVAGAASAAPNGTIFINNNTANTVDRAANSFNGSSSFPASITASNSGIGTASSSGTLSGTVIYVNSATGQGCQFSTLVYSLSGVYQFSLSAAPYGSGSTATCTYTTSSRNTSTGAFTANWNMSGF